MVADVDLGRRWGLTGHDRSKLRAAVRGARDARQLRRLQAVLLLSLSEPVAAVCRLTGLSRQSVYNAPHRYRRRHATVDLADAPRSGRPPVAPAIGDEQILTAWRQDPFALGYDATGWTVDLLARHLAARHAQPITPRTLRRRMRALRLRWKRPRHVYPLRDPHRGQKKGASGGG
jgi:transposase